MLERFSNMMRVPGSIRVIAHEEPASPASPASGVNYAAHWAGLVLAASMSIMSAGAQAGGLIELAKQSSISATTVSVVKNGMTGAYMKEDGSCLIQLALPSIKIIELMSMGNQLKQAVIDANSSLPSDVGLVAFTLFHEAEHCHQATNGSIQSINKVYPDDTHSDPATQWASSIVVEHLADVAASLKVMKYYGLDEAIRITKGFLTMRSMEYEFAQGEGVIDDHDTRKSLISVLSDMEDPISREELMEKLDDASNEEITELAKGYSQKGLCDHIKAIHGTIDESYVNALRSVMQSMQMNIETDKKSTSRTNVDPFAVLSSFGMGMVAFEGMGAGTDVPKPKISVSSFGMG